MGGLEELGFDGVALSVKPPHDPIQTALQLAYAYSMGAKKVHVLLATGMKCLPVSIYASKYFDRVSTDSSSYNVEAAMAVYKLIPYGDLKFGTKGAKNSKLVGLPCDCPVCSLVERKMDVEFLSNARLTKLRNIILMLHNVYQWCRFIKILKSIVYNDNYYYSFVKKVAGSETIKAIDFFKTAVENDVYVAYDKFFKTQSIERWL